MPSSDSSFNFKEFAREFDLDEDLYTRQEAAEYVGVSLRTIDCWISRGYLEPVRFGKTIRLEGADLRKLGDERVNSSNGRIRRTPPGPKPAGVGVGDRAGTVTITLTEEQVALVAELLGAVK